jgi:uncharacterized membrane protein YdjX (TVP38/TMEM64 family)
MDGGRLFGYESASMPTHHQHDSAPPPSEIRSGRGKWPRLVLLACMLAVLVGGYAAGLHHYLEWDTIHANVEGWREQARQHLPLAVVVVFAAYVSLTALWVPATAMLSFLCGALFDRWLGICLASVSATTGAALAFLISRYLLHDWVRRHFGARLQAIDRGVHRDGAFYLFTLRLTPVPAPLVNVCLALTPMRLGTFVFVSWLGMLVPHFLFVNAGTELAHIERPADVLSPSVLGSLALLGVMPLVFRLLVMRFKRA